MKVNIQKMLIAIALVTMSGTGVWAQDSSVSVDDPYYQISEPVISDVTEEYADLLTQPGLQEDCSTNNKAEPKDVIDEVDVILDKIINIGKKLWKLVENGRPVVNVKTYTANALPKGIACWSDLASWSAPQSKVYRIAYVNGFGVKVVEYDFRVTFTAGGSYKGNGKYITNATIMTAKLNVAWGYTFNAEVSVPSVFNIGSEKSPVAGMQMVVKWNIDTAVKHGEQSETFYITGNNEFTHLP